jgi:outer membrane protein assembly factor BamB
MRKDLFGLTVGCALVVCVMAGARSVEADDENWPRFRGPGVMGQSDGTNLPEDWGPNENIAWKVDVPGSGWASPVVWEGKVYVATVVSDGNEEAHKKGLYLDGDRLEPSRDVHHWQVHAYDLKDGTELWKHKVHTGVPTNGRHLKNTYASETPVADENGVYAYFGNVGIFGLSHDGEMLWKRKLPAFDTTHAWGTGSSPVLHKGRIYIVHDNDQEQSYMVSIDAKTGTEIWKIYRDSYSTFATPFVWENELRTEIVTSGGDSPEMVRNIGFEPHKGKIRSYDLEGNLLWELNGGTQPVVASPFSWEGNLYITNGWVAYPYRPLFVLRPGMSGEYTFQAGETKDEYLVWSSDELGPYHPTPIIVNGRYYTLFDQGFLRCNDARTGEEIFGKQRIGGGAGFTSSPWSYQGKIFCLNEDGQTFVIEAGNEFKVLGVNELDEMCMATPAISGDSLLIRGRDHLYCIRNQ